MGRSRRRRALGPAPPVVRRVGRIMPLGDTGRAEAWCSGLQVRPLRFALERGQKSFAGRLPAGQLPPGRLPSGRPFQDGSPQVGFLRFAPLRLAPLGGPQPRSLPLPLLSTRRQAHERVRQALRARRASWRTTPSGLCRWIAPYPPAWRPGDASLGRYERVHVSAQQYRFLR